MKVHWTFEPKGSSAYLFDRYYIMSHRKPWNYGRGSNRIDYCCETAEEFFQKHDDIELELDVKDIKKVGLNLRFVSDVGWYGDIDRAEVPLSFCPFCGAKVELVYEEYKQ